MPLAPGLRLGSYEVVAPLGTGGMGEVYRARDSRLGRDVAIKVLPADVASSPERLARLEREARAVAALNHPNIVTLFSLEDEAGVRFLTMELVEGQSLDRLVQFEEARAQYEEGARLAGTVAGPTFGLAHLEASMGHVDVARGMLEELKDARARRVVSAWGIAVLHANLGDVGEAFRWLDTAVAEGAPGLVFLRVHPRLDPIRQDARYDALVARVGLDRG